MKFEQNQLIHYQYTQYIYMVWFFKFDINMIPPDLKTNYG